MDEPENRMHVQGILVVEGDVDRDRIAGVLGRRLARIPRFSQRIADRGGDLVWTVDRRFDLGRHVLEERLPEPGGDAELTIAIERYLHEGFDRAIRRGRFTSCEATAAATRRSSPACITRSATASR
jgi:hypothetical protein